MRIARDQLVFRALVVCDEAVDACHAAPIKPGLGPRFALMFLYAVGDGSREAHDALWRVVQDEGGSGFAPEQVAYMRSTAARTQLKGIARSVGVAWTSEYMISAKRNH